MKKLDKLIYQSFLGPFLLTLVVVIFILLMQLLLRYFDDLVGKDLGVGVLVELFFYLAVYLSPQAFPLAVLLASLITFGNLGEHFELTAIKASGISLLRALQPIFFFAIFLTGMAFYFNSFIVPKANAKAFRLLWDVKQKKAAMQLPEGSFYRDLPGFQIKANKKFPDGRLREVIIYDHSDNDGNTAQILADSGKMYTIMEGAYLVMELYSGNRYAESTTSTGGTRRPRNIIEPYERNDFDSMKMVFSLSSFEMGETDESLFQGQRMTKTLPELLTALDSMSLDLDNVKYEFYQDLPSYFSFHLREGIKVPENIKVNVKKRDSILNALHQKEQEELDKQQVAKNETEKEKAIDSLDVLNEEVAESQEEKDSLTEELVAYSVSTDTTDYIAKLDSAAAVSGRESAMIKAAQGKVRGAKTRLQVKADRIENMQKNIYKFEIAKAKKYSEAFACLIMFLIGAPLGSIIKKGGLGMPVLISIAFFIVYYVVNVTGDKWAKEGIISSELGLWLANILLLPIGLFFLRQAKNDARIFEVDYYKVAVAKLKKRFGGKKIATK
ncbi:LptF/LptG family permease [Aureibacter tunicatorum]|uniref:Lipopolysaccharide export system permease protein n=1 Tax=Aureibacter tunicatorum TaxID=866807 RepID=A0AAE3XSN8_9BACT|nr:LptF/LptG family permease [Aureibacter tunicatorum]MDR6241304.1 lipopolysaccharide export system permease protein [Aureibacter tunicatorum]BDD03563.1 hypothetical protein AUTU_10460 [Aureibacter tunicatorum]